MTGIFEAVRGVSCIDAASRLGLSIKHHGERAWARCPFHGERTPSLCLYEGARGFYCFGCHEGGDAVRLYAKVLNVTPLDAAYQLATDFGISVTGGAPMRAREPTIQDIRYVLAQRRIVRYDSLVCVTRRCEEMLTNLVAATGTIELRDRLWGNIQFRQALMARTRANEELDRLEAMTLHELAEYFREVDRDIPGRRSERASENAG
jgi:hypothetical protein